MSVEDQVEIEPQIGEAEIAAVETQDAGSSSADVERRLRREMQKLREQARSAQAERDAAIVSMRAENDKRLITAELRMAAMRSGIIDVDALRLIDAGHLAVRPDGVIDGAEDAILALKSAKPYLFDDLRQAPLMITTGQPRRPPAPAQPDAVNARTLSREQWQAERARVLSRNR
jgi:hypothetical protein